VGLHPAERVREYRDKGYWTDDMIDALLRERVSQFGDITAITDPLNRETVLDGPFRTLTWPELDEQVSRLAQVLLAEGVGTGDVVGVQLPNTVEIVVAFLAIVRIGAIVAPFPVQYRAWELTHLSNVAQVRAFLTASRIGQRPAAAELAGLRPQIPSLRWVGVFGAGLDERIAAAEDRAGLAAHLAGFSPDPNDCVTICWTSGTESTPKGVPRTHYDWMAMCTGTVEGPDLTADDVLLNPFPMVNMAGINGMFLPWLKVGGLLIPDPAVRAQYFPRYGVRDWEFTMARSTLARIVDPQTGAEITEAGVPGELRIKGPGVFPGYLPASGVPDPFDEDGYLRTGDILQIAGDDLQYLRYVDRSKDMVARGGMKISAAELEGLVAGHPKVADVAVVAYPDEVLGERACAVVVPRPGQTVTLEEIVAYLRDLRIATFKLPERLELRDELPRNPLGKILKRELRDEFRN
jgi:acyl-CoA synthetase (AMP-forming)/AMP-acid ligase II